MFKDLFVITLVHIMCGSRRGEGGGQGSGWRADAGPLIVLYGSSLP